MRRYLVLLAIVMFVGAVLAVAGRGKHHATHGTAASEQAPLARIALAVLDSSVDPQRSSVPSGARVGLSLDNRTRHTVVVVLSGYQDRLTIGALAPGGHWAGQFLADRPGDDFEWIVDGEPRGRLAVTGSHLVEGHR